MPKWSLYEKDKELKPLIFSNGKNQEDIVREIIDSIKQGNKIIFLKGVCGTGKSIIALNIAKELGKASVVVPFKALQKQYEDDYTDKKYLLKEDKEKLKIKIIKGRKNFSCPFLKENVIFNKGENLTLDIFDSNQNQKKQKKKDNSCDNIFLPCKIEIKEKNLEIIRDYLSRNKKLKSRELDLKDVRRVSIASICPYWSPITPIEMCLNLDNCRHRIYTGLKGKRYVINKREDGCEYYEQYDSYIDSDVLIFNSDKYKIETDMNRKPETEIEIIDECDEFLDSFSNSGMINLNRLYFALQALSSDNYDMNKEIEKLIRITREILNKKYFPEEEVLIKNTEIIEIIRIFLDSELMNYVECDEENYCYHVEEIANSFADLLDETYVFFERDNKEVTAKLVTINLGKKFKEMLDKNKIFLLMSGTVHSEKVLKEIFGLENFKVIEAETKMPGKISFLRTGMEINCKYENFKNGKATREKYLLALNKCLEQAVKPVLIHVNSFKDLPSEEEVRNLNLKILAREKFFSMLKHAEDDIKKFKNKETNMLYTTKCNRGADFPGDVCNSIILTRFPYPDISSPFWKLLRKLKPEHYNSFYLDKARRELLQRIYRGLRFKDDHIYLLSPDIRVFENLKVLDGK